jgi:hypothetical protein
MSYLTENTFRLRIKNQSNFALLGYILWASRETPEVQSLGGIQRFNMSVIDVDSFIAEVQIPRP